MRVGGDAVGPDQGPNGTGVDRRLISEEPMVWPSVAFALPQLISFWPCPVHCSQLGDIAYVYLISLLDEPISNTCRAANWQTIDLTTITFPTEMTIDYLRVYQRANSQNIGCDPPDYPTMGYINNHSVAYSSLCFFLPGISFMLADSISSCRPAVAVLDVWGCRCKLHTPQELDGTSQFLF
jgi:hypothetical protein